MELVIGVDGQVRCLYDEAIPLARLGAVSIRRASYVEPDAQGRWRADLAPVGGPVLGPFDFRSAALEAEAAWLTGWLVAGGGAKSHPAISSVSRGLVQT
jgi:hypothetical protein